MISLTVNGNGHQLDVEPETPLLWVIRDELALTGTKCLTQNRPGCVGAKRRTRSCTEAI